ncbi:hypothetical protein ANRL4_04683 [Anaerolineae bacterium]|nr:hypothetical protein ANRL4_04683 [Anaerolineae bacterium]
MSVIWSPKGAFSLVGYRNEADLEQAILQVREELFGRNRIYLDIKKKIGAKGGLRNIPDGYLIDLNGLKPKLYVVENELASHDPLRHVAVQLLEFSLSFASERRAIKTILFNSLQTDASAKGLCEKYAKMRNYRNLDHMLEEMVFDAPFAALVIIDEMSDRLQTVLAEKFRFGVEVLQMSRYQNGDGEHLYHFEPFLAGVSEDLTSQSGDKRLDPIDVDEVDTIVVPAQLDGFQEVFLGENRWRAVRIHGTMRPQIKYIAAYQIRPIQAITHVASVSTIEPWGDTGKSVVNFSEPAHEITPIKLVANGRVKALQNIRYTTLKRLQSAKTLDDVW